MSLGDQQDRQFGPPLPRDNQPARKPSFLLQQVGLADIYQAAMNRAVQDHELDKLFNPDFYDYQI